jgi:hypothetical protein
LAAVGNATIRNKLSDGRLGEVADPDLCRWSDVLACSNCNIAGPDQFSAIACTGVRSSHLPGCQCAVEQWRGRLARSRPIGELVVPVPDRLLGLDDPIRQRGAAARPSTKSVATVIQRLPSTNTWYGATEFFRHLATADPPNLRAWILPLLKGSAPHLPGSGLQRSTKGPKAYGRGCSLGLNLAASSLRGRVRPEFDQ